MRFLQILILLVVTVSLMKAQNLVPNPSFEKFEICPQNNTTEPREFLIPDWRMPTTGTPDYFNQCSSRCGVPMSWAGQMPAKDGVAYIGFISQWTSGGQNNECRREYVMAELKEPLVAGNKYCVRFYVTLADFSQFATDGVGVYFSENRIDSAMYNCNLPFEPHIGNAPYNIIYNDAEWTEISGIYPATGNEKYIIIGNFWSDAKTQWVERGADKSMNYAYYFVDNVSVSLSLTENDCECKSKRIRDYNAAKYNKNLKVEKKLENINVGYTFTLHNVKFTEGDVDILPESLPELNLLVQFLTDYKDVEVTIYAYPDNVDSDSFKQKLVEGRGRSISEYLSNKGIDSNRLKVNTGLQDSYDGKIAVVVTKR